MALEQLWTEKYRPKTINDYVWRDDSQKYQIEGWVKSGSIPHIMLTGSPGVGKCLAGTEPIIVVIDDITLFTIEQQNSLYQYKTSLFEFTIPIGEFFKILDIDDIDYETPIAIDHKIRILTPSGDYTPVRAFVKKRNSIVKYSLECGVSISCSPKHLIFNRNRKVIPIEAANEVQTINGPSQIINSELIADEADVYDVALDAPHKYITPNGVIHHNTTLAKVLINDLKLHPADVLELNASKERGVEVIRNKISNFASTIPFGSFKIALMDEADYLTPESQATLRGIMEQYSDNCRFIFTANSANMLIPPIHSRCQSFHITNLDMNLFTERAAIVLATEEVDFDLDTLDTYVSASFPDLRKTINNLQKATINKKLTKPSEVSSSTDYRIKLVELFKAGKIIDARKLACASVRPDEMNDFFKWAYNSLHLWSNTQEGQDKAILIIRNAVVNNSMIADTEINLSAMLVELTTIES